MAVTIHQISRWYKMLTGQSIWHVNQNIGKCFSKEVIQGYYNNMTEKVTKMPDLLDNDALPQLNLADGKLVYFPVAIFQYGLGAYDLYLQTNDQKYLDKFKQCADWAINNLDSEGRWNNFFYIYPNNPYGAMAQGEGVSLLIRAYKYTGNDIYISAAKKALDFMLTPVELGGVTKYVDNDVILLEYTHLPIVLNGSIFAWWGLYDYVLVTGDTGEYKKVLDVTLDTMIKMLPKFKSPYWSMYNVDGLIASPFYHNLHVAQMQAMYELTGHEVFEDYAKRWEKQQKKIICKGLAFVKKAYQKIIE